jgi:hypothetical protein
MPYRPAKALGYLDFAVLLKRAPTRSDWNASFLRVKPEGRLCGAAMKNLAHNAFLPSRENIAPSKSGIKFLDLPRFDSNSLIGRLAIKESGFGKGTQ